MRYNHFSMLPEKAFTPVGKRMTLEGGDGGSAAPVSSTTNTSNISPFMEPYVTNMLNAAQGQIYNSSGTGFNPYTPYSTNPANYVASFAPLQQQAQSGAANLQLPGQYNLGSNLAAQAGYGSLNAANNANALMGGSLGYGNQGANYGNIAAGVAGMGYGAGQNFANQATNPAAVQAYMNPYLQSSLDPQMAEMRRQYGITGQQEQANATQAGAFGGSREALMAAENQRNMNMAMNNVIGQGYNTAFNNAQAQQQFASNLGLQGMQAGNAALNTGIAGAQTGLQGIGAGINAGQYGLAGLGQAGTQGTNLANIGSQQLAAQQGILGTQAQQGALQQQQQQNIINQAVQNYATAQQYPFMQLGLLNSMLRGLPMQSSSTQMYQAAPNMASQLGGLAAAGILGSKSAKRGGLMDVKKYDVGGAIPVSMMNPEQLQAMQKSPAVDPFGKMAAAGQQGLNQYISSNPQAINVLSQAPTQLPPEAQAPGAQQPQGGLPQPGQDQPPQIGNQVQQAKKGGRIGLDSIATGDMTKMAGGGILAFADGEEVPAASSYQDLPMDEKGNVDMAKLAPMVWNMHDVQNASASGIKAIQDEMAKQKANEDATYYRRLGLAMAEAPSRTGHGLSDFISNAAHGWGTAEAGQAKDDAEALVNLKSIANYNVESAKADEARRGQLLGNIMTNETAKGNKEATLAQIASNKEIQAKSAEDQRTLLAQTQALKVYQDTKIDIYNKLITAHPEMDVEEAKRMADTEAYRVMHQSPLFKYLTLEKPAAPPPPAPPKPGFWENIGHMLGGPNATVPQAAPAAAPTQPAAAANPVPANTNSLYYQLKQQQG